MPLLYREDPAHLPPPSRWALHYQGSGREGAPPLLLVPGWTLNAHLWDGVREPLEARFRVVRLDPRGTGDSTSDPRLEHSRVADAEDLEALLDALRIERAHLVGHSKGARTAGVFAMSHPERVLSAVFVGSGEPHGRGQLERNFRPIARAWAEEARRAAREEGIEVALAKLHGGKLVGKLRTSPAGMALLHRAMEGYSGADLLSEVPLRAFDTEAHAAALTAPALVVCGELDPFLDECRYAAAHLPDGRLEALPRCGHMPMLECPEAFAAALERFYDALSVPPSHS